MTLQPKSFVEVPPKSAIQVQSFPLQSKSFVEVPPKSVLVVDIIDPPIVLLVLLFQVIKYMEDYFG